VWSPANSCRGWCWWPTKQRRALHKHVSDWAVLLRALPSVEKLLPERYSASCSSSGDRTTHPAILQYVYTLLYCGSGSACMH
jgi:hypothetical protein